MFSNLLILLPIFFSLCNAADHQVIVGGSAGLVYSPSNITAAQGDTVTFIFQSVNHTVTQSSFAAPCSLLTNATTKQNGFDSSYVPVAAGATSDPAWTLEITDTKPIWFYCRQTGHCQKGMVGSINAPTTGNTYDKYLAAAKASKADAGGAASGINSSGVGAQATAAISSVAPGASGGASASGSASSGAASPSASSGDGSSAAPIVNVPTRGPLAALLVVAITFFVLF